MRRPATCRRAKPRFSQCTTKACTAALPSASAGCSAGWTVAGVLGHVAFWDARVAVLLERWGPNGDGPAPTYHEEAIDEWINDSAKPLILALEPRVAARIALETAEAADRAVAAMSDELLERNEATGLIVNPVRAEHRLEHVEEIEAVLGRSA